MNFMDGAIVLQIFYLFPFIGLLAVGVGSSYTGEQLRCVVNDIA
jgi:hypothetical protein